MNLRLKDLQPFWVLSLLGVAFTNLTVMRDPAMIAYVSTNHKDEACPV
jgi:hypothetical protein